MKIKIYRDDKRRKPIEIYTTLEFSDIDNIEDIVINGEVSRFEDVHSEEILQAIFLLNKALIQVATHEGAENPYC